MQKRDGGLEVNGDEEDACVFFFPPPFEVCVVC